MSLKNALLRCFEDEPNHMFSIQELCDKVQKYYTLTEYQMDLDPRYGQPRYKNEVRSEINKLQKAHSIIYPARNQYELA